ncbi:MAG TPA: PQQ-binding-like beta-propeller repeat protein [Planctomycetaceae bacterium]|nr:PQQ-binding-like beta-propeller repeat protein [Planctomycetaceae bacterium]
MTFPNRFAVSGLVACLTLAGVSLLSGGDASKYDPVAEAAKVLAKMKVKPTDSPQMGISSYRNNVSAAENIPTEWDVASGKNIKWSAKLGSQTYSSPVVANGKVFIGTNNSAGYLKRYPSKVDLGVLLCFDEETGKFLWQHSSEKLPTGRVNDWEYLGICSTVYVEGNRLWYVTNRDEIVCLDTEGFRDNKNDGPFKEEPNQNKDEADVIWKIDMMRTLGAAPHNACSCSVTALGDTLFVSTSNGVDEAHAVITQPNAPSFVAMNKSTGEVLWSDKSPGSNIMHGQWSSPAAGVLAGVEQVIFAGGDGWLYSFDPRGEGGNSKLLWKFDCNPKTSKYMLERATRNPLIGSPVIYDGLVYVGVGEDPEHGEGKGHLWCIDPTKRGDVSPTLVFNKSNPKVPIAYKRIQACEPEKGDFERDNDNSAMVWHYVGENPKEFEQTMHRTLSSVAIKDNLLFVTDENGMLHCLDAKTGKVHWTHDLLATSWSTPLIADNHVYVADTDGDICVFKLSDEKDLISEPNVGTGVYNTPVVANGVLFVGSFNTLFAIAEGASSKPAGKSAGPDAK